MELTCFKMKAVCNKIHDGVQTDLLRCEQVLQATGTEGLYNSAVQQQNSVINFANTANRIRNEFFR